MLKTKKVFVALLGAFIFGLLVFNSFISPAYAGWLGGGGFRKTPDDASHPPGMTWYVRRVPVLLYNPASLDAGPGGDGLALKDAQVVWGELWTKPGWAEESTRYGLNQLYIPVNPGMTPAPAEGMKKILVPYGNWDDDILYYFQDLTQRSPQVRVIDKSNVWAADASNALYIYVPLPSRESLLSQAEGMNEEQMARWGAYLKSRDPEYAAFGGLIPSADLNRFYVRALDAFRNGGLYYYHLILNVGPQSANWAEAAETSPQYDEPSPDGKGFYRGKDWSEQLEKNPGSVPGFIGAVDWWANLKLAGPAEVVGVPGEEKEVTFSFTNESGVAPSAKVGVKREGEQKFATVLEGVTAPAWGNSTFTLKFKVEDRPYKVRVAVIDSSMLEADYKDNVVELVVKPIPPDFYIKIDPHQAEANPGQELTFSVAAGLKDTFPRPWKALVRAFHVANGVEYPAPLTLNGIPIAPDQPVEFQPGEEKQGTVTVHAQNTATTVVVKINPVDTSEDADWSDNRDTAQIGALVDIAVTAWPFKSPVDIPWWGSGQLRNGANIKVTRKDSGADPVDVVVTVDGPEGRATYTVTLAGGQTKSVGPYRFTVFGEGEYWVHIEAWPVSVRDVNPSDNVADVVVWARKMPPPETGPREPGLHAELGG